MHGGTESPGHLGRGAKSAGSYRRVCFPAGTAVLLAYIAALAYYLNIRVSFSLRVEWLWYGWLFLVLEIVGSVSIVGYALILSRRVCASRDEQSDVIQNRYVVRVFVPCYKESLEIVQATVMAAVDADLPPNSSKHVYLCDDGGDPAKKQWIEEVGNHLHDCSVHYCRRPHHKRDLNGKACNLNFALKRIYGEVEDVKSLSSPFAPSRVSPIPPIEPATDHAPAPVLSEEGVEVVAVFDADMVCKQKFFQRTLPVLDSCDMVLTPQRFYNVPVQADIFNHTNLQMWEYMLPAMDGFGCVSCTGTNFVIRAEALKAVGYFPEYTVTEDYALSLEMAKRCFETRYLKEYLAEGEAPDDVSSTLNQRHRWCTGHLQVFFSKRNPLLCSELRPKMRLIYSLGAYSYMCAAFLTPLFLLAPILAIWFGVFPIDLNERLPAAFSMYYGMTLFTLYYSRSIRHIIFLWFASTANLILWHTYARAVLGVIISRLSCGAHKISFSVTEKTGPRRSETSSETTGEDWTLETVKEEKSFPSTRSDTPLPGNSGCGSGKDKKLRFSGVGGATNKEEVVIQMPPPRQSEKVTKRRSWVLSLRKALANSGVPIMTLSLCMASVGAGVWLEWSSEHSHPIQLVSILWCAYNSVAPFLVIYYAIFGFKYLKTVSRTMAILSLALLLAIVAAMHLHNRGIYDYNEVIRASLMFYEAQRSGVLPDDNRVSWRGDSGLLDKTSNGSSLVGGYYDAGDTVKYGLPAAVSMSFLAWAMIEFRGSFDSAKQVEELKNTLKWGADYFIKAHTEANEFVAQVGLGEIEHNWWGRPEDLLRDYERIGIPVNTTHPGSDIAGSTAAAMAATSVIFRESDPAYADELLSHAKTLYNFGKTCKGLYSDSIPDAKRTYPSTSYEDDLAWGALWIYLASANNTYLDEARDHIQPLINEHRFPVTTDWDNVAYCVMAILHKIEPQNESYKKFMDPLLERWITNFTYTPKGLAFASEWGSLRQSTNTAFLALVYSKYLRQTGGDPTKYGAYECWALSQIRYTLGEGGRSYVCGFGKDPPLRPHHRGASCPDMPATCGWDAFHSRLPNPNVIYGALVGGPDSEDVFHDDRDAYAQSEVALDFNAGFTGALAGIASMDGIEKCYWGIGVFKWFRAVHV